MNTQAGRLTSRRDARVFGFAYLTKLAAWVELKRKARRAQRHERELCEMLNAMNSALLDDIGVARDANGEPVLELANQNAHIIILDQPPSRHDTR
jgi:uncharacterized protein YjiS (DUF1127 family)